MSHVGLGSVQQSFKFQSICVPIRYDVAHLADDSGEDEDAYQVTYDSEHVPGGWVKVKVSGTLLKVFIEYLRGRNNQSKSINLGSNGDKDNTDTGRRRTTTCREYNTYLSFR